jgi:hypothetical protein
MAKSEHHDKQRDFMNFTLKHALAAAALAVFAAGAFAQYIWLDEKGVRQYSDMPPPPDVPKSRIIKAPSYKPPANSAADKGATSASASASASAKVPMTTAEKDAEYNKRKLEKEKKDKEEAEKSKLAAEKERNCQRARDQKRILDSGQRVAQTGANGERVYPSEEQRAREMDEVRQILANCN